MSFRAFIYYCALGGGCMAYIGWLVSQLPIFSNDLAVAIFRGLLLGMSVAFGVSVLDALLSFSLGRIPSLLGRVGVAVFVGSMGGILGGTGGACCLYFVDFAGFRVAAWTLTGLMIGAAPGTYEVFERLVLGESAGGALRKLLYGLIGGGVGGLLGGIINAILLTVCDLLSPELAARFRTPVALGFVVLGMCIGLLIGLAQVVFKEAWLKIESGRRAGREVILSKPAVTIGRAESCDIGLFGDPTVERNHARILLQNHRYLLADENTPGGTFLNDERIYEPTPLRSGDVIRVGGCTLRFGERTKRPA